MKKIFLASLLLPFVLISCDEDFNEGIAGPRTSEPDPVQTTTFESGAVTSVSTITLADVTAETVKVCDIKVPTSSEENATLEAIKLFAADGSVFNLNSNGEIKTSELTNLIESNFGRRPVERSIKAMVKAYFTTSNYSLVAASDSFDIKAVPVAPIIEEAYYYVGATNGWSDSDKTYQFKNSGADVYDDPVFTCTIPAPFNEDGTRADNWFKIAAESSYTSGNFWGNLWGVAENGDKATSGRLVFGDIGAFLQPASDEAIAYKISINMMDQTYNIEPISPEPETWYLVGSCIGDGSWGNAPENIGTALFPMAFIGNNKISFTGYLTTAGFKLIKEPGKWDDQWGQGSSFGEFKKNDGGSGNITVPADGYYEVTLDYINDVLTVQAVDLIPQTYEVGIAGSFNGWSFAAMTKCPGSDHMWKTELSSSNNEEGKFLIDGWSVNWGAPEFPSGIGQQNGANIPIAAGNYVVIFNDITGGYNFIAK